MTGIDLGEAVEAGSEILRAQGFFPSPAVRELVTRGIVTAALPHIQRQVREQVAREIETEAARRRRDADEYAAARGGTRDPHQDSIRAGFSLAASIARGDS